MKTELRQSVTTFVSLLRLFLSVTSLVHNFLCPELYIPIHKERLWRGQRQYTGLRASQSEGEEGRERERGKDWIGRGRERTLNKLQKDCSICKKKRPPLSFLLEKYNLTDNVQCTDHTFPLFLSKIA